MSERPVPAVKAVIQREGKILVLETEAKGKNYWVLPGGKIEYGEEPAEALEREIQEELSCTVGVGEPVGMYYFFTGPENDGDQVVLTAFGADIGSQEIDISGNPADENILDYRWMDPEELVEKTGNSSLQKMIQDHLSDTPKLVRDRIPELKEADGENPESEQVEGEELERYLLEKITEEAEELFLSGDKKELADLLEVMEAYIDQADIDEEELEEFRERKRDEKGGFDKGYILKDYEPSKET